MRTISQGIVIHDKEMKERLLRVHRIVAAALLRGKAEEKGGKVEKKAKNNR